MTTVLWKTGGSGPSAPAALFTIDDPQAVLDLATRVWNARFPEVPGTVDEVGEITNRWPSSGCWFFDPESSGGGYAGSPETTGLDVWPDALPAVYCGPTQLIDVEDAPGESWWPVDMDVVNLAEVTQIAGDRLVARDEPVGPNGSGWGGQWVEIAEALGPEGAYRFFRPDGTETTWADLLDRIAGETPEVDSLAIPISARAFWWEVLAIGGEVVGFAAVARDKGRDLPTSPGPDLVAAVDRLADAIATFEKADAAWRDAWNGDEEGEASYDGIPDVVALVEEVAAAYGPVAEKVDVSNSLTGYADECAARIDELRSRAGLTDEMVHALDLVESLNEQVRAAEIR